MNHVCLCSDSAATGCVAEPAWLSLQAESPAHDGCRFAAQTRNVNRGFTGCF